MKCLIIAAGKGSRLQQRGDSKPLARIIHEQIKEIKQKPRMCENDL